MTKKKKKELRDEPAPVVTGHDERAGKRDGGRREPQRDADAPDGVSGSWS
ncbi:MAG: hypothetical protein VB039_04795 [Oscillospiraceae bacterium]|nr:hypothetical protein [Oscillospiraceae bacterium]